ncbi:hypothetical protein C2E20_5316 [Micractinium conductrix]|uniref:SGNH hydrolase-type esterase domain-containing protein n=1 Tax=Micractinium conductrix TaxID=554055 RepID=A0A2P6VB68_9CHLO|nr:hypothetical protein C2E20_5316 [Micractinium conductrix]|eukprot:PSC71318.1 hypothetical protein C2E20_5316 [Micractinium conductrix]
MGCPEPQPCPTCPKQQARPTCPKQPACPKPAAAPAVPRPPRRLRMPWQPLLSASEVLRGLSYYGSGERMRALAAKLQAGEPIKAFTLGGSVTKGQGAAKPELGYPARLFQFINATWPHKDHQLVNKGIGGTSSGVYSACAEQMVGQDPDLLIVEFTINEKPDEPYTSSYRRGYEQLLRKLLRLPSRPAVLQMHHYAWWRAEGDGVDQGLFYVPQAESQLTVFSQYYDMPSVSLRSAVYQHMKAGVPGFKVDKVWNRNRKTTQGVHLEQAPKKERDQYFFYDRTHPNDRGHQMIAELLASTLIKAAAEQAEGWEAAIGAAAGWAPEREPNSSAGLPPPMIPGNADVPTSLCAIQEGFKPVVVAQQGFEYRAERPQEETFVGQKWGWTGTQPGHWAELQFDSRDLGLPEVQAGKDLSADWDRSAEVYLTHLKGYQGFGTAAVDCVRGCRCSGNGRILDGTWKQDATLMQIHRFQVTQHKKCRVRITVRPEPGEVPQKGHKVTLTAIMVSHFPIRLKTYEDQAEQVASLV